MTSMNEPTPATILRLAAAELIRAAAELEQHTTPDEPKREPNRPGAFRDAWPDDDELRDLVYRQDKTDEHIADLVEQQCGHRPTKQAVAQHRTSRGIHRKPRRPNVDSSRYIVWEGIDWKRHGGKPICHRLRELARRDAGQELDPATTKRLRKFLARLDRESRVVDYQRDTAEGFLLVPRLPTDAPGDIVRRPPASGADAA